MGTEDVKNVVLEKLHELQREMGTEDVKNVVLKKLHELLLLLENFGGYVLSKFDDFFPPETRKEKLHHLIVVIAPFLIIGLVFITCLRCCCGRGSLVRMMKAPGRNYRMRRNVFESNPRSYFRDLRASSSSS